MKYISFAIPSYNSQEYMSHAIESILVGGEDVEIIIVNDGSSMILLRLHMSMRKNIRRSSRRWIRRMEVTAML